MSKNPRSSSSVLRWLVFAGAVVATSAAIAATTAGQSLASPVAADEAAEESGGVLEGVFPFRAMQFYNTVTSYLEYLYDTIIAPITGKLETPTLFLLINKGRIFILLRHLKHFMFHVLKNEKYSFNIL